MLAREKRRRESNDGISFAFRQKWIRFANSSSLRFFDRISFSACRERAFARHHREKEKEVKADLVSVVALLERSSCRGERVRIRFDCRSSFDCSSNGISGGGSSSSSSAAASGLVVCHRGRKREDCGAFGRERSSRVKEKKTRKKK